MKIISITTLAILMISSITHAMEADQNQIATTQRKIIFRSQIAWGTLGVATFCLTPALAASTGLFFIFEAAEASKGGKKSLAATATSLALTTASAGASIYSFWRIHKLQQLKKVCNK